MEFSYEYFIEGLMCGDQRIFHYKDMIIIVENAGETSHFFVEYKGVRIIKQIYKTPQLLLENARIDGKSLQEIWDDLELV